MVPHENRRNIKTRYKNKRGTPREGTRTRKERQEKVQERENNRRNVEEKGQTENEQQQQNTERKKVATIREEAEVVQMVEIGVNPQSMIYSYRQTTTR